LLTKITQENRKVKHLKLPANHNFISKQQTTLPLFALDSASLKPG